MIARKRTPHRFVTCAAPAYFDQRSVASVVAMLAMMPLRHRAFAGLRIGESLLVTDRVLTVSLSEELTKTGVPFETDVLEPAAATLPRYLSETRPFLMARTDCHHDYLWVGNQGEPMSYS